MRLRAKDQIHISAVKPDALRPGEEFEISDTAGEALVKQHPTMFERLDGEKQERVPLNKMDNRRKTR